MDGIYKEVWEVFDTGLGYAKNYDGGVDKVRRRPSLLSPLMVCDKGLKGEVVNLNGGAK